jgi:predicted Rossmann-fold nucleotide-binding protein
MIGWIHRSMLRAGMIVHDDLKLFTVTDDPQEVCRLVREGHRQRARLNGGPGRRG